MASPVSNSSLGNCLNRVSDNSGIILTAVGIISVIGATIFLWIGSLVSATSFTWLDFVGLGLGGLALASFGGVGAINRCRDRSLPPPEERTVPPPEERTVIDTSQIDTTSTTTTEETEEPPHRVTQPERRVDRNYQNGYQLNSSSIHISILRRELKENPLIHLNHFVRVIEDQIQRDQNRFIHVTFLNQPGSDGGGLRRDYLDDLVSGVTSLQTLFMKLENGLSVPHVQEGSDLEVYKRLGEVLMYCYRTYPTGYFIDKSVFDVMFNLSAQEINEGIHALSFERKLALYFLFVASHTRKDFESVSHATFFSNEPVDLFRKERWSDAELEYLFTLLDAKNKVPQDLFITSQQLLPTLTEAEIWEQTPVFAFREELSTQEERRRLRAALNTLAQRAPNEVTNRGTYLCRLPEARWSLNECQEAVEILFKERTNISIQELFEGQNLTHDYFSKPAIRVIEQRFTVSEIERVKTALNRLVRDHDQERTLVINDLLRRDLLQWTRGDFRNAVEIVFQPRSNVTIRELFGQDLTRDHYLETVTRKKISETFLQNHEATLRNALTRLSELDTRQSKMDAVRDLLEGEWGENEFEEALALIFEEQNIHFEQMKGPRYGELRNLIFNPTTWTYFPFLSLLQNQATWSEEELKIAFELLEAAQALPPQWPLNAHQRPDFAPLQRQDSQHVTQIKEAFKTLAGTYFESQLKGVHALAKGAKRVCKSGEAFEEREWDAHWERNFHQTSTQNQAVSQQFFATLQGSMDRNYIADKITNGRVRPERFYSATDSQEWDRENAEIDRKIGWLKEWIRDEGEGGATLQEMAHFLKFVTGSSCLPDSETVKVQAKSHEGYNNQVVFYTPNPKAHSCSNTIDFSPVPCGLLEFRTQQNRRLPAIDLSLLEGTIEYETEEHTRLSIPYRVVDDVLEIDNPPQGLLENLIYYRVREGKIIVEKRDLPPGITRTRISRENPDPQFTNEEGRRVPAIDMTSQRGDVEYGDAEGTIQRVSYRIVNRDIILDEPFPQDFDREAFFENLIRYRINGRRILGEFIFEETLPEGVIEVGIQDRTKEGFLLCIKSAISGVENDFTGYSQT